MQNSRGCNAKSKILFNGIKLMLVIFAKIKK